MMGGWAMGVWMFLAFLIAVAVLVLLVVAIVRLWPGHETFSSTEPRRPRHTPDEDDRR